MSPKTFPSPFKNTNNETHQLLKEVLYNSTAQAILKIKSTPHTLIKLFWSACLLILLSYSSYAIVDTLFIYFSYEVFTVTKTIYETPTLFPKVTLCNKNLFTTKYAYEQLMRLETKSTEQLRFESNRVSSHIDIYRLQHTLNETLIDCTFNNMDCFSNEFSNYYDRNLGMCYEFNTGRDDLGRPIELKRIMRAGSLFGLKVTLYANFYENFTAYNKYLGFIVTVSNSSYLELKDGLEVSTGFKTNIKVERVFERNMPKPYSNCEIDDVSYKTHDSQFIKIMINSTYEYNQQICLNLCYQLELTLKCNCTSPEDYPLINSFLSPCDPTPVKSCYKTTKEKFTDNNYVKDNCMSRCPLQCNRTEYKTTVNSVQLLGQTFVSKLKKIQAIREDFVTRQIDAETAKQSIIRIYVFYDPLSYTQLTEHPNMNRVTLLANMGGNLSLFLGISALSFFEFIEVMLELYLNKRMRKK